MYWYVLFVRTGQEQRVERLLKVQLDTDVFMPFIPLNERLFKKSGIVKREIKPLFPSYVFIESDISNQEFSYSISKIIRSSNDIVRILKYSDTEISMRDSEKQALMKLYNGYHCIELSKGIIVGDRIHITDGPLIGCESMVKRVNRHKREAWIELEFMGEKRLLNVSLEILDKIPQ